MSNILKVTPDIRQQIEADFFKQLQSQVALANGKFSFEKVFKGSQEKCDLVFSEKAYLKMIALVGKFTSEIAWHGVAYRGDDGNYYIEDILVYPQEVSGATVTTDQNKYQMWLYEQPDEVFNNMRFQGHSHVNMATNPSAVDLNLYEQLLAQLGENDFYIFLIWNKSNSKWIKIYDMQKNIVYDTADVTVKIKGIDEFVKESEGVVETKTYSYQPAKTSGNYPQPSGNIGVKGTSKEVKKDAKKDSKQSKTSAKSSSYDDWSDEDYADYYGKYGYGYYGNYRY